MKRQLNPMKTMHDSNPASTRQLFQVSGLLCMLLIAWFVPWTHHILEIIDCTVFAILNQSLTLSDPWMMFWGYLNHPEENWINIVVMVTLNVTAIMLLAKSNRKRALGIFLYCWLSFQLILLLTHFIFSDILHITRHSPSMIITPFLKLSEAMQNPEVKDYSYSSFPAGHTLVAIYWALFAGLYAPNKIKTMIYVVAVLLCLPRVFSGAHWISDIIFTILYAAICFYVMVGLPVYKKFIGFFEGVGQKTPHVS